MAELLKRQGYETLTACDYNSAMAIIGPDRLDDRIDDRIDAAVIDIFLPRQSGIELLKELRQRESTIPVIMITGEPNIAHLPDIVRAGAYDFLAKPVVKETLIRTVANAIEKKRLSDEKRRLEEQVRQHAAQLEEMVAHRTRALAEAQSFLNTVLDSLTEHGLIAIDQSARIVLFNRGAELIFGRKAADVLGHFAREAMAAHYDRNEKPFLNLIRAVGEQASHHTEMELSRVDGSTFTASVTIAPMYKAAGEAMGHLLIVRDLTAERQNELHLRQLRERLAHNEKIAALGRMAAQVAHEVKNPLAGLRLYALHLKKKATGQLAPTEMVLIDKIIDGIHQLSDTANQVLNFARPIVLTRRRLDLNRIIADSLALLEPQLTASRVRVRLSLAEAGAYAILDEATMRSMLINLILNSIQAMTAGGELLIATASGKQGLRLSVSDTGCGMTAEQLQNMFEPFYTTKSQGLGLGMSFAAKVIEQHGGSISVESRVGEGTRIEIGLSQENEKANEANG
jgi:two-component system, LuxR family, sensor histidine kinase DctS